MLKKPALVAKLFNVSLIHLENHNNTHSTLDFLKQGISGTSANVTIRKGSHEKELLQLNSFL